MSKKDRRKIRASCAAALAQARWLISLEHGRRLLARLLAMRGSVARGAAAGALAASLALSPVRASGPFTSEEAPLGSGRPAFVDIDDDGDLDAFVGTPNGLVRYFRNDGGADSFDFPNAFSEQTGSANPFDGIDFGSYANPAFVDIDRDGDPDAFIGASNNTLRYFRNDSTLPALTFIEQTGTDHPLDGVGSAVGFYVSPTFEDLDGDGDQDAFFGRSDGTVTYYENKSEPPTSGAPAFGDQIGVTNPLTGIDGGSYVVVDFGDLNGDNLLDLVLASGNGTVAYFQNGGSSTAPDFSDQTGVTNPLAGLDVGSYAAIALEDIDNDGDQDAFLGDKTDAILFYRNDGSSSTANFVRESPNPLAAVDIDSYARPTFADIDGDGDLDVFVGNGNGNVVYYRNNGSSTTPDFSDQTGVTNPLDAVNVADAAAPALVDIDGDGDLDTFVGEYSTFFDGGDVTPDAQIEYYRNTGTDTAASFAGQTGADNPLDAFAATANYFGAPAFVDIDADGDFDAFIGLKDGTVAYYRNDGSNQAPNLVAQSGVDNPLSAVDVTGDNAFATPTFVDFDNDGDQDAFIGSKTDQVLFYRNTGDAQNPAFSQETPTNDPFAGQSDIIAPTFADIDADGDPDAFAGKRNGTVAYFENLAVPAAPDSLAATSVSTSQIDLSWADNSDNETGFVIERSPDGTAGSWTEIATPAADATSFSDTGLAENTAYFYRIQAVNGNFSSAFSNTANATTGAEAPPAPTNVSGSSSSSSEATISWDAPTGNVGGFVVERSDDGGDTWTEVANLPAGQTSFTDTGLEPETEYQYRITTTGSDGAPDSPPSDPVTITTPAAEAPPAPSNVNGSSSSSSEATINWDSPTGDVGGFIVERSTDGGETWTEVANLPAGTTSFTDENLEPETEYQYRVITVGSDGAPNSPPSDPVTVTTDPAEEIVYLPLIFRTP